EGNGPRSEGPSRRSVSDRTTRSSSGGPAWKSTGAAKTGAANQGNSKKQAATKRNAAKGDKPGFWNYPRRGKGPVHRWLPSWRFILASFLTLIALGVGLFVVAYATIDVPEPEDIAMAEGSTVYFADGDEEMGSFAEVDRQIVDAETLPDYVGDAVVAS